MDTNTETSAEQRPAAASSPANTEVVLVGIDIPFADMIRFMLKWFFASIPVGLILLVLWYGLITVAEFLSRPTFHSAY